MQRDNQTTTPNITFIQALSENLPKYPYHLKYCALSGDGNTLIIYSTDRKLSSFQRDRQLAKFEVLNTAQLSITQPYVTCLALNLRGTNGIFGDSEGNIKRFSPGKIRPRQLETKHYGDVVDSCCVTNTLLIASFREKARNNVKMVLGRFNLDTFQPIKVWNSLGLERISSCSVSSDVRNAMMVAFFQGGKIKTQKLGFNPSYDRETIDSPLTCLPCSYASIKGLQTYGRNVMHDRRLRYVINILTPNNLLSYSEQKNNVFDNFILWGLERISIYRKGADMSFINKDEGRRVDFFSLVCVTTTEDSKTYRLHIMDVTL